MLTEQCDGDRYKIVIFGDFDATILMFQWEFGKVLLTEQQDWRLERGNLDLWDSSLSVDLIVSALIMRIFIVQTTIENPSNDLFYLG